jgi:hypothetical protein
MSFVLKSIHWSIDGLQPIRPQNTCSSRIRLFRKFADVEIRQVLEVSPWRRIAPLTTPWH